MKTNGTNHPKGDSTLADRIVLENGVPVLRPLLVLWAAAVLSFPAACGSRPAQDVDPSDAAIGVGDTDAPDDSTAPPDLEDTAVPDTRPSDDTGPSDDPDSDSRDAPDDDGVDWGDPCDPPIRMWPTRGSTLGGTVVHVVGQSWYIGALAWWLALEDHVLGQTWIADSDSPCTATFVTLPTPASTRDAVIYYGGPDQWPDGDRTEPAGTFTFVDEPADPVGSGCTVRDDCERPIEICHPGFGACFVSRCTSAACGGVWSGGPCSVVRGCIAPAECETDDDCRLLYSSCSCIGVPLTDPREILDSCDYEGCRACGENLCEAGGVRAQCSSGVCSAAAP